MNEDFYWVMIESVSAGAFEVANKIGGGLKKSGFTLWKDIEVESEEC